MLESALQEAGIIIGDHAEAVNISLTIFRGVLSLCTKSVQAVCNDLVVALDEARCSIVRSHLTKVAYALDGAAIWKHSLDQYIERQVEHVCLAPQLQERNHRIALLDADRLEPNTHDIMSALQGLSTVREGQLALRRCILPQCYCELSDLMLSKLQVFFNKASNRMASQSSAFLSAYTGQLHSHIEQIVSKLRDIDHVGTCQKSTAEAAEHSEGTLYTC